jgi:hypothetical protein
LKKVHRYGSPTSAKHLKDKSGLERWASERSVEMKWLIVLAGFGCSSESED